jgi:hypothetical protein
MIAKFVFGRKKIKDKLAADALCHRLSKMQEEFIQIATQEGVDPSCFHSIYSKNFVTDLHAMMTNYNEGREPAETDDHVKTSFRRFLVACRNGTLQDPGVKFVSVE